MLVHNKSENVCIYGMHLYPVYRFAVTSLTLWICISSSGYEEISYDQRVVGNGGTGLFPLHAPYQGKMKECLFAFVALACPCVKNEPQSNEDVTHFL